MPCTPAKAWLNVAPARNIAAHTRVARSWAPADTRSLLQSRHCRWVRGPHCNSSLKPAAHRLQRPTPTPGPGAHVTRALIKEEQGGRGWACGAPLHGLTGSPHTMGPPPSFTRKCTSPYATHSRIPAPHRQRALASMAIQQLLASANPLPPLPMLGLPEALLTSVAHPPAAHTTSALSAMVCDAHAQSVLHGRARPRQSCRLGCQPLTSSTSTSTGAGLLSCIKRWHVAGTRPPAAERAR